MLLSLAFLRIKSPLKRGSNSRIKITFKGIGYKDGDNFKEKREELEKLVNQKNYTLDSYSVAFRYG